MMNKKSQKADIPGLVRFFMGIAGIMFVGLGGWGLFSRPFFDMDKVMLSLTALALGYDFLYGVVRKKWPAAAFIWFAG